MIVWENGPKVAYGCSWTLIHGSITQKLWGSDYWEFWYRDAQENGEYAACFWLCAECCKHLETLQTLSVTGEIFTSINRLYADTISRLEFALSSTCAEFEAAQYCKARYRLSQSLIYTHKEADGTSNLSSGEWTVWPWRVVQSHLKRDIDRIKQIAV